MILFIYFVVLVVFGYKLIKLSGIVEKAHTEINQLKQIVYKLTSNDQQSSHGSISSVVPQQPAYTAEQSAGQGATQTSPASTATTQNPNRSLSEEASGRWLGKLGMLAIFLGIVFFIKDAFEKDWIGPGGRVFLGVLCGAILIVVGQLIREKYKNYSDLLIGGSYGVFYLTSFGAYYFYQLISAPVAYGFFVGITALAVIMSVIDKSPGLAHVGVIFGFLAPLFLTGLSPSTPALLAQLLSYVLILDIGVAAVAYKYNWKTLSYTAFVGTLFSYIAAADLYLSEGMRSVAFLFVTLFFIVFLFVSVAHHLVRKERTTQADLGLISFNALQYGLLGAGLVQLMAPDFLGLFCIVVAIIYFVLSVLCWNTNKEDMLLNLYLPGIAAVFLTVAVPAQLDGKSVLIAWLVEALVLLWISHKLAIKNMIYAGGAVFAIALVKFIVEFDSLGVKFYRIGTYDAYQERITDYNFLFNVRMLYMIIVTVVGGLVIWAIYKGFQKWQDKSFRVLAGIWFVVINIFFLMNILGEVNTAYRVASHNDAIAAMELNKDNLDYSASEGEDSWNNKYRVYDVAYLNAFRDRSNQQSTVVSIIMGLYAAMLLVAGFAKNSRFVRICGLVLIFITALYIFASIWDLGSVYRITTAIIFGIIALLGSFAYAKFTKSEEAKNLPQQ